MEVRVEAAFIHQRQRTIKDVMMIILMVPVCDGYDWHDFPSSFSPYRKWLPYKENAWVCQLMENGASSSRELTSRHFSSFRVWAAYKFNLHCSLHMTEKGGKSLGFKD